MGTFGSVANFLRQTLSTLPERPDQPESSSRSDCHAWSAWPAHWFVSHVLGVYPATRGYGIIGIAPHLGRQQYAKGAVPTPHGLVQVQVRQENDLFILTVSTPKNVQCHMTLPNGSVVEHYGGVKTMQIDLYSEA